MRLEGKKALVTGGSRGIGRSCVVQLACEGADVVFLYQASREAADALVAELAAQGRQVRAVQADVRDAARAQQVVDEIIAEHSRLDVLVNSAGIVRDTFLPGFRAVVAAAARANAVRCWCLALRWRRH